LSLLARPQNPDKKPNGMNATAEPLQAKAIDVWIEEHRFYVLLAVIFVLPARC
jgi:hypothetical protein